MRLGNITDKLSDSLGVGNPKEAINLMVSDVMSPLQELWRNTTPKAIASNVIRDSGLDEVYPRMSALFDGIQYETEKAGKDRKKEVENSEETKKAVVYSKSTLENIKEVLEDIFSALTGETLEQIVERRRIKDKPERENLPVPEEVVKKGFLSNLLSFFSNPQNLIGTSIIASATAGLSSVVRIISFLARLGLRAGGIGAVLGSLASLNTSDLEAAYDSLSASITAFREGDFIEGLKNLKAAIDQSLIKALKNITEDFSNLIQEYTGFSEGTSDIISSTLIGASIGMLFGPKGAIAGAILGFTLAVGEKIAAWITDQTGSQTLGDIAEYGMYGAALGALFGPKGALIGAAVGFLYGVGKNLYDYLADLDYEGMLESTKEFFGSMFDYILNFFSKAGDFLKASFSNPVEKLKELLPEWLFDFGAAYYDMNIRPLVEFIQNVFSDPVESLKNLLIDNPIVNFAKWWFDHTFKPIAGFLVTLASIDVKEEVLELIRSKSPWILNMGDWLYDSFIQPIVDIMNMIGNSPNRIKDFVLSKLPESMRGWFDDRKDTTYTAPMISPESQSMQDIIDAATSAALRSVKDESASFELPPSDMGVVARQLSRQVQQQSRPTQDTIIGNVSIDQSVNTSGGGQSYARPSTRPNFSRLDEIQRGGFGVLGR